MSKDIKAFFAPIEVSTTNNAEIDSLIEEDIARFQERGKAISDIILLLKSDIDTLNKSISTTGWKKDADCAERKYAVVCLRLKDQGLDFSRLDELLSKKKEKNEELEKLKNNSKRVVIIKQQLDELFLKYEKAVNEISILRSEFIKSVIGQRSNVKFEIQRNRNRYSFVQTMKGLINKDISTIDEDISKLADVFFGKDGKDTFRKQIKDICEGINKKSYSLKFRNSICKATPEYL